MLKYAIILLIILSACSVEKRCQRHISKAKELGCLANDTIVFRDTVKGFVYDTTFLSDTTVLKAVDTFYLEKDGVGVRTVVKWHERKITETVTKRDTVFQHVHIPVKELVPVYRLKWWVWPALLLSWAALLGLIFKKWGG